MSLKPIGKRVAIKVKEPDEVTKGGIVLADNAKEPQQEGTVTGVGSDVEEVKVGDSVIFSFGAGLNVTTQEGEEYLILKEDDLLAIIKN
jgi:chaperonin GroES